MKSFYEWGFLFIFFFLFGFGSNMESDERSSKIEKIIGVILMFLSVIPFLVVIAISCGNIHLG